MNSSLTTHYYRFTVILFLILLSSVSTGYAESADKDKDSWTLDTGSPDKQGHVKKQHKSTMKAEICMYGIPCKEYKGSLLEEVTNKQVQEYNDMGHVIDLLMKRGFSRNYVIDNLIPEYEKHRDRIFEEYHARRLKKENEAIAESRRKGTKWLICCDFTGGFLAEEAKEILAENGYYSINGRQWMNVRHCYINETGPIGDDKDTQLYNCRNMIGLNGNSGSPDLYRSMYE